MRVILFTIWGFPVRSYGLFVAIAILLAIGVTLYFAKQADKNEDHIYNLSIYSVIGGLAGARLWEVLFFSPGYYMHHLSEILAVWHGGLSIQGGLVGGVAVAIWYMRKIGWNFWETADIFAPGMVLGQAVGRIACLLNGDAYGAPTGSSFGLVYPPGTMAYERYQSQPLWPAEVWEGQWDLIILALLLILKNRKLPQGTLFLIYAALYSAGRFGLEFLRGDSPKYLFEWTAAQWTSISVIAVSVILALVIPRFMKSAQQTDETVQQ